MTCTMFCIRTSEQQWPRTNWVPASIYCVFSGRDVSEDYRARFDQVGLMMLSLRSCSRSLHMKTGVNAFSFSFIFEPCPPSAKLELLRISLDAASGTVDPEVAAILMSTTCVFKGLQVNSLFSFFLSFSVDVYPLFITSAPVSQECTDCEPQVLQVRRGESTPALLGARRCLHPFWECLLLCVNGRCSSTWLTVLPIDNRNAFLCHKRFWHLEQTQVQAVDVTLMSNESLFNEKKKGCEKE